MTRRPGRRHTDGARRRLAGAAALDVRRCDVLRLCVLRLAVLGLAVLGLTVTACSDDGRGPAPTAATGADATLAVTASFPTTDVTVTAPDGTATHRRFRLADTASRREQGLMGVTALAPDDGMVFVFEAPTTDRFWMFRTVIPLDIAFYDVNGVFLTSAEMTPCTSADSAGCALYGPDGPYVVAVEVGKGRLGPLGLVPGSRLTVAR